MAASRLRQPPPPLARRVLGEPGREAGLHAEVALDRLLEAGDVPLLLDALGRHVLVDDAVHDLGAHVADDAGDVVRRHDLGALLVDDLALVVGDVVVLEQVLAHVEVVRLDLALRALDLARQHAALDRLAFLHADRAQQGLGALRVAEDAHQVVFERQVEPARARIALAARTAAQLVVDAPRLVALGADDVQAAGGDHLLVPLLPVVLEFARAAAELRWLERRRPCAAARSASARCRRARCRCRGRPCWSRSSRCPAGRPARRSSPRARAAWRSAPRARCPPCFSRPDSSSEVSIEVVPTSAGWPRCRRSRGCPR